MRRRSRDRDVRQLAGVREFYRTNGTLPREVNRELDNELYGYREYAVAPIWDRDPERKRTRLPTLVYYSRVVPPAKPGRKARLSFGGSVPLREYPHRVRECLVRKQRREVLFAFKRAGFSGSAPKRSYRRTVSSKYGC